MENTLLIGLSRQMTLERQIDVIANNVANVNTDGYKADKSMFQEYLMPVARADNFVGRDRLLSYVQDTGAWRDNSAGALEQTGNPLNVAIKGDGYLAVQTANGERYTRNGQLQINSQGQLSTANGDLVLGTNGPITFQPNDHDIVIASNGVITVREGNTTASDAARGTLRLVNFAQPGQMQKIGNNLYAAANGGVAQDDPTSSVLQGFVEHSNVNAVSEMTHLIEVSRMYTHISAILQQQGDLRKTALEKLADVTS